jgi:CheY-like chemotaxis protein
VKVLCAADIDAPGRAALRPVLAPAVHAHLRRSLTWIDDVLADSFPASDPPSWTSGIARPAPPTAAAVAEDPRPRALFVSYVEDERALYGDALAAAGFQVHSFADPSHARDAAITWQPDVFVTRILQLGSAVDGLEFTRRIRQHPRTRNAAVLVITSLIAKGYRAAAADAGPMLSCPSRVCRMNSSLRSRGSLRVDRS